jgi:RNA polymerase sigma factor (sigma-70 family)
MGETELSTVVRHIRKLAAFRSTKEMTDRQLLEAFLANRDDTAFAALVKRHGPLVLAISRRVLHQQQDAEDAFQATFLVLAQSAASIRKTEALGSWLHGVAYRIALRARRDITRRRVHEREVKVVPHPSPASDLAWPEVQVILDEEIQGLPEKYRAVFVLCCLEGKNGVEVAKELGLKEGTVRSRLSQARRKLQHRLARRGITLSAVLGAAAIAVEKVAVPAALADTTVRAALLFLVDKTAAAGLVSAQVAALVKEAGKAMFLTKLKTGAVLVLATGLVVAAGAGVLAQLGTAIQPTPQVQTEPPKPKDLERRGERQTLNDPDAGPVPAEAIARIGSTRFRQWGEVTGLAYSPDGQWLASISTAPADSRVWDAATGKEKLRVQIKMVKPAASLLPAEMEPWASLRIASSFSWSIWPAFADLTSPRARSALPTRSPRQASRTCRPGVPGLSTVFRISPAQR